MEKSNVKIHSAITKIAKFGGITEGAAVADLVAPTNRRKVEVCPPIADGSLGPQDSANGPAGTGEQLVLVDGAESVHPESWGLTSFERNL